MESNPRWKLGKYGCLELKFAGSVELFLLFRIMDFTL